MTVFLIPGKPFAKQRPRFGAGGRTYTPAKTVSFERQVGVIAMQHFPKPIDGPVRVDIAATFELPRSWPKKRKDANRYRHHTSRPDLDNLIKAVTDGLNRIAYHDDSQIAELEALKVWGMEARTVVRVTPIGPRLR